MTKQDLLRSDRRTWDSNPPTEFPDAERDIINGNVQCELTSTSTN